LVGALLQIIDR